jgi:uncharacterized protein
MSNRRFDGTALHDWAHTALNDLVSHADEINTLNVFPVADADTGTNMLFTLRSAVARVDGLAAPGDLPTVAGALAAGAVQGARGNSGMIPSQILRGAADVTAEAAGDRTDGLSAIDTPLLAAILQHAVGLVVSSLGGAAVPGTIVTVLEAAARAAEVAADAGDGLAQAVAAIADAAAGALEETPKQLAVLADAGVVDSGGRGLLVLLDALTTVITGHRHPRAVYEPEPTGAIPVISAPAPPQFEVMYQLDLCAAPAVEGLRARLDELGESVAIAAATGLGSYSVHVHTDDAGAAIEAGLGCGTPSRIQIAALTSGVAAVAPGGWTRERAVLAVVDGVGAADLFAGEGAAVLRMAPERPVTAQQLIRGIVDTGAAQVMVLPNGYVAAEELVAGCTAAIGWGIDVVPLPTGSMVQGLAALAVHDAGRPAVDDGYAMAAAIGATRYGAVRIAPEDALTWAGPCRAGDGLGIIGDEVLVVRHDATAAARGLIDLMLGVGGELVTMLLGADLGAEADLVGAALKEHVRQHHLGTELVTYRTLHDGDAVLIGVE